MKFTMDEWDSFFNWLSKKYGISEETYYNYDEEFCDSLEEEFYSIAKA